MKLGDYIGFRAYKSLGKGMKNGKRKETLLSS